MNKLKSCLIMVLLFAMVLFLDGCSLAKEDANEEKTENSERLVGVVITTEHLEVFDEEAFIDENIDEIVGGEELESSVSEYVGRIYATVDKHDSEEPLDWEISFEGIDGINFINVTWRDEENEPFSMMSIGDEIGDIKQHFSVTDEGDFVEMTGTLYLLLEETADEVVLHLNPVYETTEGALYVTPGDAMAISGESGIGSMSIENKTTNEITDETGNTLTQIDGMSVQVNTEVFRSKPSVIRFHYMNDNLSILNTQEYEPGKISEQVIAEDGSTCVIVETEWADGTITRELIDLEKDGSVFVETLYVKNEKSLAKQSTEIIWK